jgi:hypothetical protein
MNFLTPDVLAASVDFSLLGPILRVSLRLCLSIVYIILLRAQTVGYILLEPKQLINAPTAIDS